MILGIAGLAFHLGGELPLGLYPKQQVTRERERQDRDLLEHL